MLGIKNDIVGLVLELLYTIIFTAFLFLITFLFTR